MELGRFQAAAALLLDMLPLKPTDSIGLGGEEGEGGCHVM